MSGYPTYQAVAIAFSAQYRMRRPEGYNPPMLNLFRIMGAFLCLAVCVSPSAAQRRSVALTFDDLPVVGTVDPAEARSINISILDSLDQHHAPAIGFVIESRVEEIGKSQGQELLNQWVERGYELGNHTFSHTISDDLTTEQFERGIVAGETSFAAALAKAGKTPRYFRFPQSHTGNTKEKHDAIAAFLVQRHYKVAVCTIDNEDYAFNAAYVKMLSSKDNASAAKLRTDYLAYTSTEIDYYSGLHKQIFGREIPHVMLLHVNRLNADLIDKLLELFGQKQYQFVTLDAALSDPAYNTPDSFVPRFSKFGPMWGYRWAAELGVRVNGALESEPPAWVLKYGTEQK
jgi:peptidoglycan/xylan/chitin deacetylase (PgdA/CDA1 family)